MEALSFENYVGRLLSGARTRGKRASPPIVCDLTAAQLHDVWNRSGGCCEVSGLAFSDQEFPEALVKRPFAPSIDRIIPGGAYTLKNIRLVCVCANFSMNEWGLETLLRLARAVVDRHSKEVIEAKLVALWRARLEGRIDEALVAGARMNTEQAKAYGRRIAGLRRALTMSPEGLQLAAARARATARGRLETSSPS